VQRDFLYALLDGSFSGDGAKGIRRACMDSSGIGGQLAEEAAERFGRRVEGVVFTGPVKEDLALGLRRRFEEKVLRIPAEAAVREDIHSVRRLTTASGNARFDAQRTGDSHADRFWALALAVHACGGPFAAQPSYESVSRRQFSLRGCW
jgi:phage FluMu gp28-like protein